VTPNQQQRRLKESHCACKPGHFMLACGQAHTCRCLPAATLMKERRLQKDSCWESLLQPCALRAPASPAQGPPPHIGSELPQTQGGRPTTTVHSATTRVSGHGSHPTHGTEWPHLAMASVCSWVGKWYKMSHQHTCVLGRCQPCTSCARWRCPVACCSGAACACTVRLFYLQTNLLACLSSGEHDIYWQLLGG
jgi:hypothetical protein